MVSTNPENRDYFDVAAECFVRSGAVQPPFSGEYMDILATGKTPAGDELDPILSQLALTDEFERCIVNPSYDLMNAEDE